MIRNSTPAVSYHWKTWAKGQYSQGSWPLPHQLISELTMVRTLQPANASPDWKLSTVPEMKPLQSQRSSFYACFAKKDRNGLASANQGIFTASQDSYSSRNVAPTFNIFVLHNWTTHQYRQQHTVALKKLPDKVFLCSILTGWGPDWDSGSTTLLWILWN